MPKRKNVTTLVNPSKKKMATTAAVKRNSGTASRTISNSTIIADTASIASSFTPRPYYFDGNYSLATNYSSSSDDSSLHTSNIWLPPISSLMLPSPSPVEAENFIGSTSATAAIPYFFDNHQKEKQLTTIATPLVSNRRTIDDTYNTTSSSVNSITITAATDPNYHVEKKKKPVATDLVGKANLSGLSRPAISKQQRKIQVAEARPEPVIMPMIPYYFHHKNFGIEACMVQLEEQKRYNERYYHI